MKKTIFAIILLIIMIMFTACPKMISETYISQYPHKLVYVVGHDNELDLLGGEITFVYKYDETEVIPMSSGQFIFEHDIDFTKPGVYTVTIVGAGHITYEIEVVAG